ncbi:MAG TPA: sensor histidine kinase [Actinomycetota bacterium]|nr:sensor histidine kinase [Actinomycetota bacterium]
MGRERTASRLPWIVAGLILAIVLAGLVFLVMGLGTPQPATAFAFRGYGLPMSIVFVAAGVLVASRVPANPIGWLLLAAGAGTAIQELAQQYAIYGLLDSPGAVPGAVVAAWLPEWVWIPFMAAIALYIPLFYPDGHLPSRRWAWVAVLGGLGATIGTIAFALTPGPLEGFLGHRNPFGVEGAGWIRTVGDVAMLFFLVALLGTVVSLVVRVRRSRGDERQQLKWLALAIALLGVSFLIGVPYWTLSGTGASLDFVENLVVLGLAGVPVAIGISILKFRLYDIDVVIKKTVVYAILAAFITVVYVAVVIGIGALVGSGGSVFLSAVAAAAVAVAFQPARRRAQRVADRLVYGERATPYEVLSGFSERLAETYSVDDVLPRMARVLAEGVGAATVTILLGTDPSRSVVARWPLDHPPTRSEGRSFEVRHQGQPLGAIEIATAPGEDLDPTREKLVADVAAQAGLVLRNAALIEDLRASRQRLVTAQDQERRRIERNIHDGAQQQLVALAVKLKLADSLVGKDEVRAHQMLAALQADAGQTLEDLRDLARGIYPPLLADKGLGAALESQARKSPVPVSVETDGIGRYPQEAEAAVYFSCLEALQNVAKYADASRAIVRLAQTDGVLAFEVSDDGLGFDPGAATRGSGLQGIVDRLAALGGEVDIRSAPGSGATVSGRLPISRHGVTT